MDCTQAASVTQRYLSSAREVITTQLSLMDTLPEHQHLTIWAASRAAAAGRWSWRRGWCWGRQPSAAVITCCRADGRTVDRDIPTGLRDCRSKEGRSLGCFAHCNRRMDRGGATIARQARRLAVILDVPLEGRASWQLGGVTRSRIITQRGCIAVCAARDTCLLVSLVGDRFAVNGGGAG